MSEGNASASQDEQTTGLIRAGLAKLPEGWEWARVGDLAMGDIQTGPFGARLHRSEFVSSGVPVLAIGNVKWGYVDLSEIDHVTPEKAKQLQRYVLRAADVLFTRSGTVGRSAVLPEEADRYLMTGHILRIRLNPEIYLPELLFRAFRGEPTMEQQLQRHTRGMTRAGFNTALLSSLVVPLPPPAEQRRIVAKIEALQERSRRACEALSEVGPLLEQFRQSILAAAFRGDLTADWRAAHPNVKPASELLQHICAERRSRWEQAELAKYGAKGQKPPQNWKDKYKEPEPIDGAGLPELPEGWEWSTFDEVSLIAGGLTKHEAKRSKATTFVPLISVAAVQHGYIDSTQVSKIGLLPIDGDKGKLETNDLLIVEGNGSLEHIGRAALWNGSINNARHQNHLIRVRPVLLDPRFAFYWLGSPRGRTNLVSQATSAAGLYNLSLGKVGRVYIPIPPLDEQTEIIKQLDAARTVLKSVFSLQRMTVIDLDQLDQAILAKAFRGELVPQDPSDEPASVLLERIRAQRKRPAEAPKRTSNTHQARKMGKKSSWLTPQQLTLAEVLSNKA